jgi:hypothetical protein
MAGFESDKKELSDDRKELYSTMLAGVVSGSLSRIPLHPIDTIKTRQQASTSRIPSALAAEAISILRNEGIRALYRGFGVAVVAGAPASCLYFTSYELSKTEMLSRVKRPSPLTASAIHLAAGLVAEAASCVLWVPIDVIKVRMQVQKKSPSSRRLYTNAFDAMRHIVRTEGLHGLYRGYGATLTTFGPFSGLYFVIYEKLKSLASTTTTTTTLPLPSSSSSSSSSSTSSSLSSSSLVICASLAAAAASFLTSPLDLIRLRMQVSREIEAKNDQNKLNYKSVASGLSSIISEEGMRGLFRGATARVAFATPSTALAMVLFEKSRDLIRANL